MRLGSIGMPWRVRTRYRFLTPVLDDGTHLDRDCRTWVDSLPARLGPSRQAVTTIGRSSWNLGAYVDADTPVERGVGLSVAAPVESVTAVGLAEPAGIGQAPHIVAKADSDRIRVRLSPAWTSISAAVSRPTPTASTSCGAGALRSRCDDSNHVAAPTLAHLLRGSLRRIPRPPAIARRPRGTSARARRLLGHASAEWPRSRPKRTAAPGSRKDRG